MPAPKRIALYFHATCRNRGCEAIIRTTCGLLQTTFPGARITLYSHHVSDDQAARLPEGLRIGSIFPPQMATVNRFSLDHLRLRAKLLQSQEAADEFFFGKVFEAADILREDLFLSIGGDNYCYGDISYIAALNQKITAAGKPAVLWGCSVGEENLTPQKRADLRRYALFTARETKTLSLLRSLGLGARAFLHPDPAFLLAPEPVELPQGFLPGQTVALNLSGFAVRASGQTLQAARALIKALLADSVASVALVPHVFCTGDDDRETMRPLLEGFAPERVFMLAEGEPWSAGQLKYAIAQCRAFIGARTHATIAAYSSAVPTLALGYSVKARGIAADLFGGEAEGLVLPVEQITPQSLCAAAQALLERENELRRALQAQMPKRKDEAAAAAARLAGLL
ncbi:MAG: polysaccharide pyruvyl transferase family protein [Oscillospiraceae bacterium]|jgi:polysaccharide pyruvyl transferase WcaK-like protein|nr:polysaccharide pyruvyl transferase family protein [Oscillospiraceae bacterium]